MEKLTQEAIEAHARNAATRGPNGEIPASRSRSTGAASATIAGIADGEEASFTIGLSPPAATWAQTVRSLSRGTLELLNVGSGTAFFPKSQRQFDCLVYRYPGGWWKARSYPAKDHTAKKGFKGTFWNLERVLAAAPQRVFITEGELDACALVEAGIPATEVLSVPNGARERPSDKPDEGRGNDYVKEALAAGLNRVKTFVWCGDLDGPGRTLRSDMARLLGVAKFHFVEWPEDCKDANDTLRAYGPEGLQDVATAFSPWPVMGIYRLGELPEPPPFTLWHPGFPEWESKVLLAPRTMSVVTGHPGNGKTALWAQIWFNVVRQYDVPICVASFETRPKPHYRQRLRTLLSGKLEKDMSEAECAKADAWISERYLFLVHPEQRPTLAWFLEMAEVAIVRHGARIIQVDPWNRMEASRGERESETDYIGRCLRELYNFAHDMNCHVQILAHPAKMEGPRRNHAPNLEDISGSKNWDNMVDQGFVIHRPHKYDGGIKLTEAFLHHEKARFEELGYPCKLAMNYDVAKGAFRSTDYDLPEDVACERLKNGRNSLRKSANAGS